MAACLRFAGIKFSKLRYGFAVAAFNRQWQSRKKINLINVKFLDVRKSIKPARPGGVLLAGILTWLGFKEEEKEDVLITTIKRGILCLQREEYDKAENILHLALKLAQERQDMEGQRYVFDVLANVAYNKRDFPKAEKLFLQVTKELVASGTSVTDNAIVEISLKLASIYSQTNETAKAEEGYRYCIETQSQKLKSMNLNDPESLSESEKNDALLWGMSMDWYARHLLAKGSINAAREHFQKALEISEKINGPSHPQTLILMNDIGSLVSLEKNHDKAIEYFETAISRSSANDGMPELATFYCNLGATYFQKNDFYKATEACSKALTLAKKRNNPMAETDAIECLKDIKTAKEKIT